MRLEDLFVSYKQVEPIDVQPYQIKIPNLYSNLDRVQQVTNRKQEVENPNYSEHEVDMSTWKVNNDYLQEVTTYTQKGNNDFNSEVILNNQSLNTSLNYIDRATEWLKAAEGFRSKAYKDGKYFSVGYGFNNPKYTKNTTMTLEEANKELRRQITTRAARYQKRFGSKWDNLSDNQKIALISYGYNVGDGRIIGGTIAKMLDSGNLKGVRNAISINTAGGEYHQGLENRRIKERDLFDGKRRSYHEAS